jgi:pimeloyl-ACP methyl ester carboxylesterase
MGGVDLRPDLPQIRQPVLLVRTEGEGAVSAACQEELAAALPHAKSEWLHTTGQLPYLTHPHRLAKLVKSFLVNESSPHTDAALL